MVACLQLADFLRMFYKKIASGLAGFGQKPCSKFSFTCPLNTTCLFPRKQFVKCGIQKAPAGDIIDKQECKMFKYIVIWNEINK